MTEGAVQDRRQLGQGPVGDDEQLGVVRTDPLGVVGADVGVGDRLDAGLGVAEEHLRVVPEEQRVLHAGVAGGHRALEDDDLAGLPQ